MATGKATTLWESVHVFRLHLAPFAADLAEIAASLGIPPSEELKWHPRRGSFLQRADGQLVKTLRRRMPEAAAACQVRTVTVILDHSAAYTSYPKAEAGKEILKWPYERASMFLGDNNDVGIMIADKPGAAPGRRNAGSPTHWR